MAHLRLRIDLDPDGAIGPGKVEILERIQVLGSIAAAGRAMGMSYRRAWELVDSVNRCFAQPVVTKRPGGIAGGSARLTPFGQQLVGHYRAIERKANRVTSSHLAALQAARKRRRS